MKKTKWFPCSVKPVRSGVYEVQFEGDIEYGLRPMLAKFTGGRWRAFVGPLPYKGKATGEDRPGFKEGDRWRGIAK